jgi:lysyl-tRNA synthetase, class II
MDLVEEMVEKIAMDLHGKTQVQSGENLIDFRRPWKRFSMYEAIEHFTGTDVSEMDEEGLRSFALSIGVQTDPTMGRGKLIDEIFGEKCEHQLIQPTFITDYPVEMSPLAKKHRSKPGLVERFEAICNGKEICNAFSELNDPIDQRQRFEDQLELARRGDQEAMVLDEDFLRAIETGMPPTAGLGIGIDRLAMIMTNSASIQDVLFFPQMRPERKSSSDSGNEAFIKAGIPEIWARLLPELGYTTLDALKEAKAGKIFNQLCGQRKKRKIDVPPPSLEEVQKWIGESES